MMDFCKDCQVVRVSNRVAASQSTLSTSIVNLGNQGNPSSTTPGVQGPFDAVAFIVLLQTVSAGSVLTATVQDNSANQSSGMANVTASYASVGQTNSANATVTQSSANAGIVFTDVSGNSSNEVIVIDCALPALQYVRLQITIGTANCAFDGVLAVLYRARNRPTLVDASVGSNSFFVASS